MATTVQNAAQSAAATAVAVAARVSHAAAAAASKHHHANNTSTKRVTFADSFGLNLVSIFLCYQRHLQWQHQQLAPPLPRLTCDFTQPSSLISFYETVKRQYVSLEVCSATTRAGLYSISCTIRVVNVSFEKSVIVRYTTNEWSTWTDVPATYVAGSCNGWSDKFTCTFTVPQQTANGKPTLAAPGQRVQFAIKYIANDQVYWDNNGGRNYTVRKA